MVDIIKGDTSAVTPTVLITETLPKVKKVRAVSSTNYTTSSRIWSNWYNTTASTWTTATSYSVWDAWNDSASCTLTGSTTGNTLVWKQFMRDTETTHIQRVVSQQNLRKPSEEEVRRVLAREQRLRAEADERVFKEQLANEKALRLLRACLTPKQREDLEKKKCFYVEVKDGDGRVERYRLDYSTHGNVAQLDEKGSIIRTFCVQPEGVPVGDAVLTQKLYLESSEKTRAEFFEKANITEHIPAKRIPHTVPRPARREYARQHGILH